jgi:hypothetical protein
MVKFLERETNQALEEFFGIPLPQVRHILLQKGIMDIMNTVTFLCVLDI